MPFDVELVHVSKTLGNRTVLHDIHLSVAKGELVTLLGPSGCGKSTTLNIIAGFLDPDEGEIRIKGRRMNRVPPYQRDLGMVFQSYSLFPHMTVYENVEYGLKLRKVERSARKRRIEQALELVKMNDFGHRYPRELSGGQRQRVAIARALVVEPKLLLLDEPLSNLDAKLREELRLEIKRLQHELGVTTIFVTHDQEEALSLSDRVVVMNEGRIEQIGPPTEVYHRPASEFVYTFIGKSNVLYGVVGDVDAERRMVLVRLDKTAEPAPVIALSPEEEGWSTAARLQAGSPVKLYLRPEKIALEVCAARPGAAETETPTGEEVPQNRLPGTVAQMNYLGAGWEVVVQIGAMSMLVQAVEPPPGVREGSEVCVAWPANVAMLVPA